MKDYLAPGVLVLLFFLAFVLHSIWPLLLIIPLILLWLKKKPEQPYYVPSSQNQDAVPKEAPRWDNEQPQAQYPEQPPPTM
jgi:hypothetical protein